MVLPGPSDDNLGLLDCRKATAINEAAYGASRPAPREKNNVLAGLPGNGGLAALRYGVPCLGDERGCLSRAVAHQRVGVGVCGENIGPDEALDGRARRRGRGRVAIHYGKRQGVEGGDEEVRVGTLKGGDLRGSCQLWHLHGSDWGRARRLGSLSAKAPLSIFAFIPLRLR